MYEIKCVYENGVIETLASRPTAAKAKELMAAYRKQGQFYRGYKAMEFWTQKKDAEIPAYIANLTLTLLMLY